MGICGLRRVLSIGALLLASPALFAASQLQRLELSAPSADAARLVLNLSATAPHKVFSLEKPDRVVIDLSDTRLAASAKLPAAGGPVTAVRSGTQAGGTLRLVLELKAPLAPRVVQNGAQLTIELGAAAAVAAATPAAPVAVRAAHAPGDSGRDVVVAIDPGHGGKDPGAIGRGGTREKDVVLAISRELARRIDAEPGMKAVLTRNDDRFIALRDRMALARRAGADVFISVHADAIQNRTVTGSSVYVLSLNGASSEAARWLAERENAADLKGGVSLGEVDSKVAPVLMDVLQSKSIGDSMEAAERVLSQLDRVGTVRKTQVQQAGFVVLKSPDIPSMLVETAFISNPGEEQKLRSPAHQKAVADAIFNGVREHFRQNPPDGTLFAQQRNARRGAVPVIAAGGTGP